MTLGRSSGQETDGSDEGGDLLVMAADATLQFEELGCEDPLASEQLSQADKGADDMHAHVDSGVAIEHVGRLNGAVLGEGVGKKARIAVFLGTGRSLRPVP